MPAFEPRDVETFYPFFDGTVNLPCFVSGAKKASNLCLWGIVDSETAGERVVKLFPEGCAKLYCAPQEVDSPKVTSPVPDMVYVMVGVSSQEALITLCNTVKNADNRISSEMINSVRGAYPVPTRGQLDQSFSTQEVALG